MTQPNKSQSTAELIERTLESLRAAQGDLANLAGHEGGMAALMDSARGTALLHDLRLKINELNKVLPFKG